MIKIHKITEMIMTALTELDEVCFSQWLPETLMVSQRKLDGHKLRWKQYQPSSTDLESEDIYQLKNKRKSFIRT